MYIEWSKRVITSKHWSILKLNFYQTYLLCYKCKILKRNWVEISTTSTRNMHLAIHILRWNKPFIMFSISRLNNLFSKTVSCCYHILYKTRYILLDFHSNIVIFQKYYYQQFKFSKTKYYVFVIKWFMTKYLCFRVIIACLDVYCHISYFVKTI